MDVDALSSQLTGLPIPQIQYHPVIGSTNDAALRWANEGAVDGCLVAADQQTHGRGRLGRQWITRPGSALAFSLIFRPTPAEQERISLFSGLGALAISQALEETLHLAPEIKWPNDILIDRRKAAGVLVEAAWQGEQIQGLVIGIGVNVAEDAVPSASELMFPATSVETHTGQMVDRWKLLHSILRALFHWRSQITEQTFYQAWERRLAFKGEWVQIEGAASPKQGEPLTGLVSGIDKTGNLILQTGPAKTVLVSAGDVHLRAVS